MKLDTLKVIRENAECKKRHSFTSNDRVASLPNFSNNKLVQSTSLEILKINK